MQLGRVAAKGRRRAPSVESLETRRLLSTLTINNDDTLDYAATAEIANDVSVSWDSGTFTWTITDSAELIIVVNNSGGGFVVNGSNTNTVTIFQNTASLTSLTFNTDDEADTVRIEGNSATSTIQVNLGAGDDTLTIADGVDLVGTGTGTGAVDGGVGTNHLDYGVWTTPVDVDLDAGTGTSTGGISNFNIVTGGSAADSIVGSAGEDTLHGGAGDDTLEGGAGDDELNGDDGDDALVGGLGADTINGGNNDDTIVWNPGDGSDEINGDAGIDTLIVNGSVGANNFGIAVDSGDPSRQIFDGDTTNGGFQLDIGTIEDLTVNLLDGDDTFIVDNSNGLVEFQNGINLDAGDGDDLLTVTGDPGGVLNATYTPGPGADEGALTATDDIVVMTINFSGLEPVEFLTPSALLTINVGGLGNTINLVEGGTSSVDDPITGQPETMYEVNFDGEFEQISFRNQDLLVINAEDGLDTITMDLPNQLGDSLADVEINSGLLVDIVQILATPLGVATAVDMGDGILDATFIGVTAAAYGTGVGSLTEIQGTVNVTDGALGGLFVDNSGDTTGDDYVVTGSSITGTGFADITYSDTFLDIIELLGGTGDDTYDIQGTSGVLGTVLTLVEDFGGTNGWTVALDGLGLFSEVDLVGGPGDDIFTVNAGSGFNAAFLNIDGGVATNELNVNGSMANEDIILSLTGNAAGVFSGFGLDWSFESIQEISVDGGGSEGDGGDSFLLVDNSDRIRIFDVAPRSAVSAQIVIDLGLVPQAIFIDNINNGFTINGDGDDSGDQDALGVFAASTTGLTFSFELGVANGSDEIYVDESQVDIFNATVGQLLVVNLVTSTFMNLDVFAGNEDPEVGDTVFAIGSANLEIFIDGGLPAVPANPGDTIVLSTLGDAKVFNNPIDGPPYIEIEDSLGSIAVQFVNFETIDLFVGSGVLTVIGDVGGEQPYEDLIEVVGTAPNEGLLWLNDPLRTMGPLHFFNVDFLNVLSGELADTLDVSPYADNTPQGWGIAVFYDQGGPIPLDLLIVNGVAGVSEDIVVRPSDADDGQVIVTQAVTNVPIVIINYVNNIGIIVNGNDGSLGDTDQLFLHGATGSPPNTDGNTTVVIDLGAAGGPLDPLVTVADGLAGPLYQIDGLTNFNAINVVLGDGNDEVYLTAHLAIVAHIDVGGGNNLIDAATSLIGVSLTGGPGNDTIIGGEGDDTLFGGEGSDVLIGGLGDDFIYGGGGQDFIDPGLGFNIVDGGEGQDWLQLLNFPLDGFTARAAGGDLLLEYGDFEGVRAANIDAAYVQFFEGNTNSISVLIEDLSTTALDAFLIDFPGNGVADTIEIWGSSVADNIGVAVETIAPSLVPLTTVTLGWGKVSIGLTEASEGDVLIINGQDGDDVIKANEQVTFGPSASTVLVSLLGGNGNDYLSGDATLIGGAGNDTLVGSPGNDSLDGGDGDDLLIGGGGDDTLLGGSGNDTLVGGSGNNVIDGGDGFDIIPVFGSDFADTITITGAGVINISGSSNNDGNNIVSNVELLDIATIMGDDTVTISSDVAIALYVDAGEGDDVVDASAAAGPATLLGGAGNDSLIGTSQADTLVGGYGEDTLEGGAGDDYMAGGLGDDLLIGGAGADTMFGGDGSDVFVWNPGDGPDILEGGGGNDAAIFNGSLNSANDFLLTRNGTRFVLTRAQGGSIDAADVEHVSLSGGNAADFVDIRDLSLTDVRLVDVDLNPAGGPDFVEDRIFIHGTNSSDDIGVAVVDGQVQVEGLRSQVNIQNSSTDDCLVIFGHVGNDVIQVAPAVLNEIFVHLIGGFGNDLLIGATFMEGNEGNDTLIGTEVNDSLLGGLGNDLIEGLGGNDLIFGDADGDPNNPCVFNIVLNAGGGNDTIYGGEGNDTIFGQAGHDLIFGDEDDDLIFAGTGNDTVHGGEGNDTIFGEVGNDTIFGDDGDDNLLGGDGSDTIHGGNGNDTIQGEEGNDWLYGEDGDDIIFGGDGNDNIFGGDGNDIIQGNAGNDIVYGDAGNDVVLGNEGDDLLDGGEGNDVVLGGDGDDTINGGAGNDSLFGDAGNDLIHGEDGDDVIMGGSGNDTAFGGDGNDIILGDAGDDELHGDAGDDLIFGSEGNDLIDGGPGNDILLGNVGHDTIYGGDGNDMIDGGAGDDWLSGDSGDDRILGREGNDVIYGGAGNDWLLGGIGNDTIFGDVGNDTLCGEEGDDALFGGSGNDFIIAGAGNDFASGGEGSDTIFGGEGNDLIHGDEGDDFLFGNDGDDTVYGNDGNDMIYGEAGDDLLIGGFGNDTLVGGIGDDRIHGGDGIFREPHQPLLNLLDDGDDYLVGQDGFDILDGGNGNNWLDAGDDLFKETLVAGNGNDHGFIHRNRGPLADVAALDGGYNVVHSYGSLEPSPPPIEPICDSSTFSVFTIGSLTPPSGAALTSGLGTPIVVVVDSHTGVIRPLPRLQPVRPVSNVTNPRPALAFWSPNGRNRR